ncbi:MAG: response regulator [Verrucomicrobiota bacterium]|nr:response regulator [Verrucomicrobiota bacterium]
MNRRILCVDDDPNILNAIRRNLRKQFEIDTAEGGAEALTRLHPENPYAVVLVDMKMPGMNGVELLESVRKKAPDTVRIMLTGNADQQTAIESVNRGHVFMFLCKPCSTEILSGVLERGVEQYRLINAERELLENTLAGSMRVLTDILSIKDLPGFGFALLLQEMVANLLPSFPELSKWEMDITAMLSQVGMLTVPEFIVDKYRSGIPLTSEEQGMLASAYEAGSKLLSKIPRLEGVCANLHFINKNFDGTGRPFNHAGGNEIPLGARLLRICHDLISNERVLLTRALALEALQRDARKYDPVLLARVIQLLSDNKSTTTEGNVKVSDLKSGTILSSDIASTDGLVLMTAGTRLSPVLIERLNNYQLLGLIDAQVKVTVTG